MNSLDSVKFSRASTVAPTKGAGEDSRPVSSEKKNAITDVLSRAFKFFSSDRAQVHPDKKFAIQTDDFTDARLSLDSTSTDTPMTVDAPHDWDTESLSSDPLETISLDSSEDERISDSVDKFHVEHRDNVGISKMIQTSNQEDMDAVRKNDYLAADLFRNTDLLSITLPDGHQVKGSTDGTAALLKAMIGQDNAITSEERDALLTNLERTPMTPESLGDGTLRDLIGQIPDDSQTLAALKMTYQSILAPVALHMATDFSDSFAGMPLEDPAARTLEITMTPEGVKAHITQNYDFKLDPSSPTSEFTVGVALDLKWDTASKKIQSDLEFSSVSFGDMSAVPPENVKKIQARLDSLGATRHLDKDRSITTDVTSVRNTQLEIYTKALGTLLTETDDPSSKVKIQAEINKVQEDMKTQLMLSDTSSTKSAKESLKEALGNKSDIAGTKKRMESLLSELDGSGDATRSAVSKGLKKLFALPGVKHLLGWNVGLLAKGVSAIVGDPIGHKAEKLLQTSRESFLNTGSEWHKKIGDIQPGVVSTITPANAASKGTVQNTVMMDRELTGVTCQSNGTHTKGAANNQMTSLISHGKTIFSGVRHALVATKKPDPATVSVIQSDKETKISDLDGPSMANYLQRQQGVVSKDAMEKLTKLLAKGGKSDIQEAQKKLAKQVANHSKAVDLLRSALHQKLESMAPEDRDKPLHINLTSVSLVTPDSFRSKFGFGYHEKQMLAEQKNALALLANMSAEEKTSLLSEFKAADGTPLFGDTPPELNVTVATFNFGVNELEQAGRDNQREMNAEAMETLMSRATSRLATLPDGPEKQLLEKTTEKTKAAFEAYQELGLLGGKQSMPYEMPVLVAALDSLCDGSLFFNCKSGKDRTSMLDVQAKIFLNQLQNAATSGDATKIDDALNYFSRMDTAAAAKAKGTISPEDLKWLTEQQSFNKAMLNNSGNREVQEENTSGWGYKLEGRNTAKMFNTLFGVENLSEVYGFSKFFGA